MSRTFIQFSIFLLLAAGTIQSAFAQGTTKPPMTIEDFRKQAPAPLANRPFQLPKPIESTLPNGLKVVIVPDKRLPLVSFRLAFNTGSASDPKNLPGLNDTLSTMLTEGTATRTSKQIADEVARLGGSLSAGSGADWMTIRASSLSIYHDQMLALLADVALHATFPETELTINRTNSRQGLEFQRSQPAFLANERFSRVVYGDHPYGTVSSTAEALDGITRERLLQEQKWMLTPRNATLIIVGDVRADVIQKRLVELFGDWANPTGDRGSGDGISDKTPAPARAIYVVDRPGSQQSNIMIGNLAIKRTDPDYFSLLVMNQVLGAGGSSRLFMNLREAKGYTYGAYSALDARRLSGDFEATSEVRTPVTGLALKGFFFELDRIRTEPVPEKEMTDAKAYLTGVFPLRLETQEGLIEQLVTLRMMGLPADYLETYRDRINAVTAADVQRVAQKYVTPDKAAIIIVGDAKEIADQIKPYATTIEYYDMMGKRKELTTTPVNAGPVSFPGTWNLTISAPGQSIPATLKLKQEGEKLTGSVESQLGPGTITNMTITENKFDGTLTFDMRGQALEMKVSGSVTGDSIEGTIVPSFPGVQPFPFTGTRAKP
ncbi:MAG: pitrilysin family protein [Pyrinomonadaceae bacterium]